MKSFFLTTIGKNENLHKHNIKHKIQFRHGMARMHATVIPSSDTVTIATS